MLPKIGMLVECLCSKLQKDVLFLGFAKTVMSSVEDLHSVEHFVSASP